LEWMSIRGWQEKKAEAEAGSDREEAVPSTFHLPPSTSYLLPSQLIFPHGPVMFCQRFGKMMGFIAL